MLVKIGRLINLYFIIIIVIHKNEKKNIIQGLYAVIKSHKSDK